MDNNMLRARAKEKNIRRIDIASELDVNLRTVDYWFSFQHLPTGEILTNLCDMLELSKDELKKEYKKRKNYKEHIIGGQGSVEKELAKKEQEMQNKLDLIKICIERETKVNEDRFVKGELRKLSVDQIDSYEQWDYFYGYDEEYIEKLKWNIKFYGLPEDSIHLFEKDNGRYLIYSDNDMLVALKDLGIKTAMCSVDGPVPNESLLALRVLRANRQYVYTPLTLAHQISSYDQNLTKAGLKGKRKEKTIESIMCMKRSTLFLYKKVLKLTYSQKLMFTIPNVPIKRMLTLVDKLSDYAVEELYCSCKESWNSISEINKICKKYAKENDLSY